MYCQRILFEAELKLEPWDLGRGSVPAPSSFSVSACRFGRFLERKVGLVAHFGENKRRSSTWGFPSTWTPDSSFASSLGSATPRLLYHVPPELTGGLQASCRAAGLSPWDASMCSCCRAFAFASSLSVGWDPEGWTNWEWMSSHQASGHAVQSWRLQGTQVHKGTGQAVLSEMNWAPRIQDRLELSLVVCTLLVPGSVLCLCCSRPG